MLLTVVPYNEYDYYSTHYCLGLLVFSNTTHWKLDFFLSSGLKVPVIWPLRKTHLQSLHPLSAIKLLSLYKETVYISHLLVSRYEVKQSSSQADAIVQAWSGA
jgi:hypothetical protein